MLVEGKQGEERRGGGGGGGGRVGSYLAEAQLHADGAALAGALGGDAAVGSLEGALALAQAGLRRECVKRED